MKTAKLDLRISPDLKERIYNEALRDSRTMAAVITLAVEKYLASKGDGK